MSTKAYKTFTEFWPFYLNEHKNPLNRQLHFIGTALTFLILGAALFFANASLLLCLPLVGYGFAWFGHFRVEKNRPATFTYPLWSLIADYKMFFMILTGHLPAELQRLNLNSHKQTQ